MKILILLLLAVLAASVRPPSPLCRSIPLPPQLPVSIGERVRFDLEDVFSGYNLYMKSQQQSHIKVTEKYTMVESKYPMTYNFSNTKIKGWGRFLGLVSNGAFTELVIGMSNDAQGLQINQTIHVQSIENLHCYDVDSILTPEGQLAIVDCAIFAEGEVLFNQFIYVNISTKQVIEGSHIHDTFVRFNSILKRRIEIMYDPFSRIPYLMRFHLRDGLSAHQAHKTYMEVFMMDRPKTPQLLDVIDHTFFEMESISIADYQIHINLVYILIYNKGLYELRFTPDQNVQIRSRLDMQLDITKFSVDQLGFNDDLNLVMSNENTIYQFEWDVVTPPVLTNKYTLVPKSTVKQLFLDYNFVIAVTDSVIDGQLARRSWIFTKRSTSYLNAYNVFHQSLTSPHIVVWNEHGSTLHIFQENSVFFVNMSLPYLEVNPVDDSMINKTENFQVVATSIGDDGTSVTCSQKFQFLYLSPNDTRILKTGYWPRNHIYVDSPDKRQIPLIFEFLGSNLTYEAKFESNSSIHPRAYVDKQHQATFKWPTEIKPANIVYFEMFLEVFAEQIQPKAVYGLVQTEKQTPQKTEYQTYYVKCDINVFNQDEVHHLDCSIVHSLTFSSGRILEMSQMYDPKERRVAIVFDSAPNSVFIYFFWPDGFGYYGRKDYSPYVGDRVTGIDISDGKLFVVRQYAKCVDIYNLEDLHQSADVPVYAKPRFVIDKNVMSFFRVDYFAPVNIKVSRFHKEAIFLKTKTGIMVVNVNEDYLPELLYRVDTTNINYDFEVNHDHLLILTKQDFSLFDLDVPLRRNRSPYRRQTINHGFHLGQYDEVCSDKLFYIVGNVSTIVVNPNFKSISTFFSHVWADKEIVSVDAVNIRNKEMLFMRTKTDIFAYVFTEEPRLTVEWTPKSADFNMSLSAHNLGSQSQPYRLSFEIIDTNQTEIQPTEYFNQTEVANLGHLKSPKNIDTYQGVIQINDTHWFNGTVLDYQFECTNQECWNTTKINNHVEVVRTVVEGRAIYDIQSSDYGIFAQQYASVFKTYTHNDSIHFINMVPTTRLGEVCTKLATGQNQEYVVSLCELGSKVNLYITTLVADKPFTFGPYQTDAKAVNYAKIEGQILMIVDNEDNPFVRSGGILLYHLNFDFDAPEFVTFLDYLDHEDLQIQGYVGTPYIGSADIHRPFWNVDHEYRVFLTESRTGAIFVFGFEVSADGQEVVYLSKKYISLESIIPTEVKYPSPLKVQNIVIHYAFDDQKIVKYYLLLSVANWHHMELMLELDHQDEIVSYKVERLFERFPWTLQNYFKYRRGRGYSTFFAVPYVDFQDENQLVLIYQVPNIINHEATTYKEKYAPHSYSLYDMRLPLLGAFGGHSVGDIYETAFDFHNFGGDKLLWSDMAGINITELALNQNVTLNIKGRTTPNDTILVTALNPFSNYSFTIDVDFTKEKDNEQEEREILGIVIIGIGVIMILGVLIAFCRQRGGQPLPKNQMRATLITQEDGERDNINRSSVDPQSVRQSIDPIIPPVANNPPKPVERKRKEEPESISKENLK